MKFSCTKKIIEIKDLNLIDQIWMKTYLWETQIIFDVYWCFQNKKKFGKYNNPVENILKKLFNRPCSLQRNAKTFSLISIYFNWHVFIFQNLLCCASDILEGKGNVQVAITVCELTKNIATPPNTLKSPQRYQNGNNINNINNISNTVNGNNVDGVISKSSSSSSQLSSSNSPTSPIV